MATCIHRCVRRNRYRTADTRHTRRLIKVPLIYFRRGRGRVTDPRRQGTIATGGRAFPLMDRLLELHGVVRRHVRFAFPIPPPPPPPPNRRLTRRRTTRSRPMTNRIQDGNIIKIRRWRAFRCVSPVAPKITVHDIRKSCFYFQSCRFQPLKVYTTPEYYRIFRFALIFVIKFQRKLC